MTDTLVHKDYYVFDEENSNGGESLMLTIEYYDNGEAEKNLYTTQELTLHSYGNSASFNLSGTVFTPIQLRELADMIEQSHNKYSRG